MIDDMRLRNFAARHSEETISLTWRHSPSYFGKSPELLDMEAVRHY